MPSYRTGKARHASNRTANAAETIVLAANVGRALADRLAAHESLGTIQQGRIVFNRRQKR
jgi:hypothetical protein